LFFDKLVAATRVKRLLCFGWGGFAFLGWGGAKRFTIRKLYKGLRIERERLLSLTLRMSDRALRLWDEVFRIPGIEAPEVESDGQRVSLVK